MPLTVQTTGLRGEVADTRGVWAVVLCEPAWQSN